MGTTAEIHPSRPERINSSQRSATGGIGSHQVLWGEWDAGIIVEVLLKLLQILHQSFKVICKERSVPVVQGLVQNPLNVGSGMTGAPCWHCPTSARLNLFISRYALRRKIAFRGLRWGHILDLGAKGRVARCGE